ncbi:dephospho-CoA kinase [Aphanothece sacrum FPU1]|uniref:Dephospho-CoA kinase n=1 Tax=Aphanothece sacrum FPU1 TaxID=1920663 RepID=A0A401ILJ9_APHSA|nr:dephospho-CoA kinase [Aphanothece sacrum FPU1]GBF86414.1 dephospho-CoA kinase [Aphanothece sacrum FPU3]
MRRIIGLTGGIATGKTTVSRYLGDTYHLPIFDADIYAREAVNRNSPILTAIFNRYGSSVILGEGELNRQALGDIIFNDSQEKLWLESQIHPYVRHQFEEAIQESESSTIILVIPLLFESNLTHLVTEIWVVSCPYDQQIKRLMTRNNLTEEQAIIRINSQLPLSQKIAAADVVLENDSTLDTLYQQIDQSLINDNIKSLRRQA